jgi:hypothetical protein
MKFLKHKLNISVFEIKILHRIVQKLIPRARRCARKAAPVWCARCAVHFSAAWSFENSHRIIAGPPHQVSAPVTSISGAGVTLLSQQIRRATFQKTNTRRQREQTTPPHTISKSCSQPLTGLLSLSESKLWVPPPRWIMYARALYIRRAI